MLADARAFSGEGLGFGWSWDDLAYYYAAPIAAAQFRENAVDITVRPGPAPGAPVTYELTPAGITGLRIENRMSTGARTAAAEFVARRAANSATVVLEGVLPVGSPPVVARCRSTIQCAIWRRRSRRRCSTRVLSLGGPPPLDASADTHA